MKELLNSYHLNFGNIWRNARGIDWLGPEETPRPRRCCLCRKPEISFYKHDYPLVTQVKINGKKPEFYYLCRNHGRQSGQYWLVDCFTNQLISAFGKSPYQIFVDRWKTEFLYWAIVISRFAEVSFKGIAFYPVWLIHKWTHKIEERLYR